MYDTDFSWARLERLLKSSHAGIEWHHDVDYSPACALEMARLEQQHGIKATYFIRPCSDEYNPYGPEVRRILRGIIGYGHALGLHVDLGLPRDADVADGILTRCCAEAHALLAFGYPVTRKVSLHAPPAAALGREITGFKSAHSPYWQQRWIGDSRGVWRTSPEEAIAKGESLRVNLHPEWHFWPQHLVEEWREREAVKP